MVLKVHKSRRGAVSDPEPATCAAVIEMSPLQYPEVFGVHTGSSLIDRPLLVSRFFTSNVTYPNALTVDTGTGVPQVPISEAP